MKNETKKKMLAMALGMIMVLNCSVPALADSSEGNNGGTTTVTSGDAQTATRTQSAGTTTVTPGDSPSVKAYQTVDGGNNEIAGSLEINATINDNGDMDDNTFELELEAWVTGSLVETFTPAENSQEKKEPVKASSEIKTSSLLDENTVLKNQISQYFNYYSVSAGDADTSVKVYTSDWDGSKFLDEVQIYPEKSEGTDTEDVSVSVNEKTINIAGFSYKDHPVVAGDTKGIGKKIVVRIYLETAAGFWGGNNVPVNDASTAIYFNDKAEGVFPVPEANVPLSLSVAAQDKTIYYGGSVSASELLSSVTAGYKTAGEVTVNEDGTFTPAAEWMDDYAAITWSTYAGQEWTDEKKNLSNTVSNKVSGEYAFTVNASPIAEASDNEGHPGVNAEGGAVAGSAVLTDGISADDTGRLYVLIPVISFKDTTIYRGFIPDDNYYETYNRVSVEWMEMNGCTAETAGDEEPGTYPAADPNTEPVLFFKYTPERGDFITDTKVDVTVTSSNDNASNSVFMADVAVFGGMTVACDAENDNYDFNVHVVYKAPFELPPTGGNGTFWYTFSGMMLIIGAVLALYKKKRSASVLTLLLASSVFILPKVYAGVGVETDKTCSVQIDVRDCGFEELSNGMSALPIEVNFYKVADINVSGKYTALDSLETLDFSGIDSETTTEDWSELAVKAKTEIELDNMPATATGITEYGVAVIDELETGLYLVDVNQVISDNYLYDFTPFLLSLPNNYYYSSSDDTWTYDLTGDNAISLKAERSDRYGDLVINKLLDAYNETLGGATFVFQIEAIKTDNDADEQDKTKVVYSDVVSMTFHDSGADSITIKGIPAGAVVTVTEVYSGSSYKVTTDAAKTVTIVAEETVSTDFENTCDNRLNGGSGVVNSFTFDSETEEWIPSQAEDSTP